MHTRIIVLALLSFLWVAPVAAQPAAVPDQEAIVTNVVDGDTIDVQLADGSTYRVRYIGIDTPETVAPGRPVACWGAEASARNRELVLGQTVYLERDTSETDRFGRLVRYVWLGDELVESILLTEGQARAFPFRPDTARAEEFAALEQGAREQSVGLWGACEGLPPVGEGEVLPDAPPAATATTAPLPTPIPTATRSAPTVAPVPTPTSPPSSSGTRIGTRTGEPLRFDPNGPDRDCSDFRTWAEAQDFYEAAGGPASDRHRLDANNDGIACETLPGVRR
jgi:micrococcal nuclease